MNLPEERFIFYLKHKDELPLHFFRLSRQLSELGIDLIPVTANDLTGIPGKSKPSLVLSICQDFNSYRSLLLARKYYLDQALINGKHKLIDVTSFSQFSNAILLLRKNRYFYIKLPINLEELGKEIAVTYYNEHKQIENWPGGKRTTLPPLKES